MTLAWIGAICIGLSLGLLGSGGSVLTVPVLVYLVGQEEKVAIAGSLFVVGSIALAGSLPYVRHHMVDWRNVFFFGVPGMAGTWMGAAASAWISGTVQLLAFAAVMIVAAFMMLRPAGRSSTRPGERRAARIAADGLVVGVVTGIVGVGGGFLIVPALVLLGGLPVHRAIATSLVVIALKSFSGFLKYMDVLSDQGLALDWRVLLAVTGFGVGGSYAGTRLARRLPQAALRRTFGVVLILMAIAIVVRTAPGLTDT
jgi:uncharacterized membrane protein YfcA